MFLQQILKFLALKRYQYEVTFSLYMLTPVEKIIFNSFLFICLSMLILAVSMYLPHHLTTVGSRAWFYYAGEGAEGCGLRCGWAGDEVKGEL